MLLLKKLKQWFQTMKSNNVLPKRSPYYNLVKPKGAKPTMVYFIVRIKNEPYP